MSEILSGCPFIKNDDKKNCEVCELTGKATGVSLICDFDYDVKCRKYRRQHPKDSKRKK